MRVPTRLLVLLPAAATVGCDRVTKHAAVSLLADAPVRSWLHDTVRLELAANISLGASWPPVVRLALFGIGTRMSPSWPAPC